MAELTTILDSGDIETLKMGPSTQAHNEGQIYYDDIKKTLSFHNDIPDVTLNIGQELYIKVVNNSGAIITNGSACRHNGVSGGLPQIELAIADNFINSRVLGIATHDIGIGEVGLLTTNGTIGGFDTSGFSVGVPMYLSSTVAGTYESVPPGSVPSIATQIGGCLVSNVSGSIQVNIENNINLPTTIGYMKGQNSPAYTNMGTGVDITDYTSEGSIVIEPNLLPGTIDTKFSGLYRVNFSVSGTASQDQELVYWDVYDATNLVTLFTYQTQIANNVSNDGFSASFNVPIDIAADNTIIKIRARSTSTGQDLVLTEAEFDIESIKVS